MDKKGEKLAAKQPESSKIKNKMKSNQKIL